MTSVRVRFAPSPTGYVHVGGLRTALYNYLFAKKHDGVFVLRIEDTDQTRFVDGATENLLQVLEWAGLIPDEGPHQGGEYGPYFQSQRTNRYKDHAQVLLDEGKAYLAFDTQEELEAMRSRQRQQNLPTQYNATTRDQMRNSLVMSGDEVQQELDRGTPYVIRLLVPAEKTFTVTDIIRGEVSFDSREVDDQILIKSDGFPTYHLANVVDDHLMKISHVIRGEEWLSSVPKHLLLYEYFGWTPPEMAHLPLIFNPDKTKMSKRDITSLDELPSGKVDPDVQSYIRYGYEREAILNYICLLGWNPGEGDERQVFTLDGLTQEFSLERVNKSSAIFDLKKLTWLNKEHIGRQSTKTLAERIKPLLQEQGYDTSSDEYLEDVVELLKSRVTFLADFVTYGFYFFKDPKEFEEKGVKKRWKARSPKLLLEFCEEIIILDRFKTDEIEATLRRIAERNEVGAGQLIHPVRLAVTGVTVGPGLFELLEVLGKETVVRRCRYAAEEIPKRIQ